MAKEKRERLEAAKLGRFCASGCRGTMVILPIFQLEKPKLTVVVLCKATVNNVEDSPRSLTPNVVIFLSGQLK